MKLHLFAVLSLLSFTLNAQGLFNSVCRGKIERVDSLLQTASINSLDSRGRSLLHWAIGCKQPEIFDHLLKKGIDPTIADKRNQTAMHGAIRNDNFDAFKKLVLRQPDSTWISTHGTSLLQIAVLTKKVDWVQQLATLGIDINKKNQRGSTPIEIAKRINVEEVYTRLVELGADTTQIRTFTLKGEYMGQTPPGSTPALFAPNVISTEESEFGSVFSADGTEFFLGVDVNGRNEIRYSKLVDGTWTTPVVILAHEQYGYNDPFLSPDEQRLYCISGQPLTGEGEAKDIDIWYVQKEGDDWSEPINAGPNINTDRNEYYISFTNEGKMYFSSNGNAPEDRKYSDYDIYTSEFVNGEFQKAVKLGPSVNTENYEADVCVAPDESYMVFCSRREGSFGQGDLYISFKNEAGDWTEAVNLGGGINTKNYEYCPFITKDGKYLFYTSNQDIYWVSTAGFSDLRE